MKSKVCDKNFKENWTVDDWRDWAYNLGLRIDRWIPWAGVDNRSRIEKVVLEYMVLKTKTKK